jgi:hypothetical protein
MKIILYFLISLTTINVYAQRYYGDLSDNRRQYGKDKFRDLQLVGDTCYGFWLTVHTNPKSDPDSLYPAFISQPGNRFYVSYTLKQIPEFELLFDSTWYWPFFHRNEPREYQAGEVIYYSEIEEFQPYFSDTVMKIKRDHYMMFDHVSGRLYDKEYYNGEIAAETIQNFRMLKLGRPQSEVLEYKWLSPKWFNPNIRGPAISTIN